MGQHVYIVMSLVLLATGSYCHENETFTRFERLFVMVSGTEIDHNMTRCSHPLRCLSLCSSADGCDAVEFNDNIHRCKLLSNSSVTQSAVENATHIFRKVCVWVYQITNIANV